MSEQDQIWRPPTGHADIRAGTATAYNFTRWDVRNVPRLFDPLYDEMAMDLFHKTGYIIIRSFIDPDEVEMCKKRLIEKPSWHRFKIPSTTGTEAKYNTSKFTIDIDKKDKTFVEEVAERILETRIRISLQMGSNGVMAQHLLLRDLFPNGSGRDNTWLTKDVDTVIYNAKKEFFSWARWMWYGHGQHMQYHLDAPGEVQSILFLTKKGVDFDSGGLRGSWYNRKDDLDIESMVEPGDLLMLDGYHFVHAVHPIVCTGDQIGRITLFMPGNPSYG